MVPKKFVSIPRLELTAAVLSTKMSSLLKKELHMPDIKERFWTDSNVVLGYIANEAKRFKIFVANRIQQIKEYTEISQWSYVPTKGNPADDASRGLNAANEDSDSRWFNGPSFLWKKDNLWPGSKEQIELAEDDPEIKRDVKIFAIVV